MEIAGRRNTLPMVTGRTRRLSFLLFVLYGFIHAALLVPLRIRALSTLTDNSWGTRAAVQRTS